MSRAFLIPHSYDASTTPEKRRLRSAPVSYRTATRPFVEGGAVVFTRNTIQREDTGAEVGEKPTGSSPL